MKRNGMCPICYVKKMFKRKKKISAIPPKTKYPNGAAKTPPMGWSSWNTFRNIIDQKLIYDTALAMKEKGIADAGYTYINLDDNWHSSLRDRDGSLQGDLTTFSEGIPALVKKINALGLKVGIYSSNGTETCEDLPASLNHERQDALTFARWGIEYFKYDFCHNIRISRYAPLVYGITVAKSGQQDGATYLCGDAKLAGMARFMPYDKLPGGKYVSGLDAGFGSMLFEKVKAAEDGDYVLTINIKKKGRYTKFLLVEINGEETYQINFPPQKHFNLTARFQVVVSLKKGLNTVKLSNPVASRADSAMFQYQNMGKELILAAKRVSEETGEPVKPILFSICEWGLNKPYQWGASAGNSWRTTPDIRPIWKWMMYIYNRTVKLYDHAGIGGWNDPDMLEVGNGKLTYDENISHFSLWCMMCAPLILGNDLRAVPQSTVDIITNRGLIAINQDALGKPAKRTVKGAVDVLVKPLSDGSAAVLFLNKRNRKREFSFSMSEIVGEAYSGLKRAGAYSVCDIWADANFETAVDGNIKITLNPHGVKVFKITPNGV